MNVPFILFADNDYDHRDPARGFLLWEALLLYGDLKNPRSHRKHWLNRICYRNDPETWIRLGLFAQDFRWITEHAFAQRRLIEKLHHSELTASGFSSVAPLDAPAAQIHADRWRFLNLDVEASAATGPTGITEIARIRVFPAASSAPTSASKTRKRPGPNSHWKEMRDEFEKMLAGGWTPTTKTPLKEAHGAVYERLKLPKNARGFGIGVFRKGCRDLLAPWLGD
jgi:hypothetical protein